MPLSCISCRSADSLLSDKITKKIATNLPLGKGFGKQIDALFRIPTDKSAIPSSMPWRGGR